MKDRMSKGIFSLRLLTLFLNVLMMGAMYIAEMIGEKAELCPTPTLVLKEDDEKPFQVYIVNLPAW